MYIVKPTRLSAFAALCSGIVFHNAFLSDVNFECLEE